MALNNNPKFSLVLDFSSFKNEIRTMTNASG